MDKIKTQSKEALALTEKYRPIEEDTRTKHPSQPFEYGVVNYIGSYPNSWTFHSITITADPNLPINRPLTTDEIIIVNTWETERYKKIKDKQNG